MGQLHLLAAVHLPRHLISPNIHVVLVHFPLGVFALGLFLEIFWFLWKRSSMRVAARWMILLGGLLSVPTALSGVDAFADVNENTRHVVHSDEGDRRELGVSEEQWRYLQKHILYTSIGSGLAAIGVTIGLGLSDRWRKRLHYPLLAVLIGAAALLVFGSHFGGEGIYLESVAVNLRGEPAAGLEYLAPARSMHVLMAGLALAVALGALGLSFRTAAEARAAEQAADTERELSALAPATSATAIPRRGIDDLTVARTLNAEVALGPARTPSSRFWLLASVLFLVALALGVWLLESQELSRPSFAEAKAHLVSDVWNMARHPDLKNRRGDHIVIGAALVVLPLILAGAVRWGARHRFLLGVLCAMAVLLIAAEIWLGVLLIYKGSTGPVYRFVAPESASEALDHHSPLAATAA